MIGQLLSVWAPTKGALMIMTVALVIKLVWTMGLKF